ncbi:unnamed protein product, partial [Timema podura]|nr:unnamed protein product [Timema podura]
MRLAEIPNPWANWAGRLTRSARRGLGGRKRDYTPVAWSHYFTERQDVKVNDVDTFRVYKAGTTGPLLVLLHGGGFSALTWSLFSVSLL